MEEAFHEDFNVISDQFSGAPDWITNYNKPHKKKNWDFYSEFEYGFREWGNGPK